VALATGGAILATHGFAALPDGTYTIGFRAHQLALGDVGSDAIRLHGTVLVSEITGSESYIHVVVAGTAAGWRSPTACANSIPGAEIALQLDPHRLFVFDEAGRLVGAPLQAQAA